MIAIGDLAIISGEVRVVYIARQYRLVHSTLFIGHNDIDVSFQQLIYVFRQLVDG